MKDHGSSSIDCYDSQQSMETGKTHMGNLLRATLFLAGGICWLAAGVVLCLFAWDCLAQGATVGFLPVVLPSGSLVLGLFHVLGFATVVCICFVIGIGLCVHGLIPPAPGKR